MAILVKMPKLGITMTEGKLEEWLVEEGGAVNKEEALFVVSTDKLSNEIESEESGILRKILVQAGETVPCQTPLAIIAGADEDISGVH